MPEVTFFRPTGAPALTGSYLVDICSNNGLITVPETFVSDGLQCLPMADCGELASGDILGVASAPLLSLAMTTV